MTKVYQGVYCEDEGCENYATPHMHVDDLLAEKDAEIARVNKVVLDTGDEYRALERENNDYWKRTLLIQRR